MASRMGSRNLTCVVAVIIAGLAYSVISPLVNIFALLAFALFWFTYKVNRIIKFCGNQTTHGSLTHPRCLSTSSSGFTICPKKARLAVSSSLPVSLTEVWHCCVSF